MTVVISLLPAAILLVLLWYGMHAIRRFANRFPPAGVKNDGPSGVDGWLLFLVLNLTLLGPLLGAGTLSADLHSAEAMYPVLDSLDNWSHYKVAAWLLYGFAASLNIYAGIGLAKGRDISVVRRAQILIWIAGPIGSLVYGVALPYAIYGKVNSIPEFFGALAASAIACSIWTLYLSKSKRVAATYGNPVPIVSEAITTATLEVDSSPNSFPAKARDNSSWRSEFARRTKIRLAAVVAVALGFCCFAVLLGMEYVEAQKSLEKYAIEHQALEYLKGKWPNFSPYDYSSAIDAILEKSGVSGTSDQSPPTPVEICSRQVASILNVTRLREDYVIAKKRFREAKPVSSDRYKIVDEVAAMFKIERDMKQATDAITPIQKRQLLTTKDCEFAESPKVIADYIDLRKCLWGFLFATVAPFVWLVVAFWVFSYPHLGWKRLAIVAGGISIPALFFINDSSNAIEVISLAAVGFIGTPLAILSAREVWLWIRRGFSDSYAP